MMSSAFGRDAGPGFSKHPSVIVPIVLYAYGFLDNKGARVF